MKSETKKSLIDKKLVTVVKEKLWRIFLPDYQRFLLHAFINGDCSTLTTKCVILIKQNIHHAFLFLHPKLPKSAGENILKSMNIITNNDENLMFLNNFETR